MSSNTELRLKICSLQMTAFLRAEGSYCYCFQRVLAIAILSIRPFVCSSVSLSVRHMNGSVKNGAR